MWLVLDHDILLLLWIGLSDLGLSELNYVEIAKTMEKLL